MRIILLFLFSTIAGFSQPVVSNIHVDDVGHSSARVTWDATTLPTNQRLQYGATSSYGNIQYIYSGPSPTATNQQFILTGQTPASTIHLCPQSQDGGGWSPCTGLDQTVTFLAAPAIHPAPAALPATFSIDQPATGSCVTLTATDLASLQSRVNTATAGQASSCYVIKINAGAILRGTLLIPPAVDVDTIASSNPSTNVITIASSINTYTNGEHVRVATDDWAGNATLPTGLLNGIDYCVANKSGNTIQLQLWPACNSVVSLGTAGSGPWMLTPFPPPHSNFIQIRTSSNAVTPDGVRPDSTWTGPMVDWGPATTSIGTASLPVLFRGGAHHYYIGPGIHFTTPHSNQTDTTDPQTYLGWAAMTPTHTFIAFKRNVFSGGYPERVKEPFAFADGSYLDVSDNYFQDISYWRPAKTNLAPTVTNSTTVTFSSGAFFTNIGNCPSVGSFTAKNPGGTGLVYFTLNPSTCAPRATLPTGTSVTLSAGITATGTDWPRNAAGRFAQALLGTCTFAANAWTGCINADDINNYGFSADSTEGPQIITACGPGPLRVANNYFESHSIIWHLDDTCSPTPTRYVSDVVFKRNIFSTPDKYRRGAPGNNGANYSNRNQWECKRCSRVLLDGNRFSGNFADINTGPSIFINHNANQCPQPCVGSMASDFTATNNTIANASAGFQLGGGRPNATFLPTLGRRFTIRNNLIRNISGWTYAAVNRAGGPGYCFQLSFGGEDEIIDHNTCYSIGGTQSEFLLATAKFIEGLKITNNIFYFHEDLSFHGIGADWGQGGTPNCFGLAGKLLLNCFATPLYTWSNNLLISGYTNSQTLSGDSDASAITSAYSGLANTFFRTETTVPGRISAAKWNAPDRFKFDFSTSSPYKSGGGSGALDAIDLGVNIDQLEDAQGIVKNTRTLSISPSSASIGFHSPDSGTKCYLGYGLSTDPTTWTVSSPDTSATQDRTMAMTALAPQKTYYYQVWCAGTAPTITQAFRDQSRASARAAVI